MPGPKRRGRVACATARWFQLQHTTERPVHRRDAGEAGRQEDGARGTVSAAERAPSTPGGAPPLCTLGAAAGRGPTGSGCACDPQHPSRFFQRIQFDYSDISVGTGNTGVLEKAVQDCADRYCMEWQMAYSGCTKRVGVLVSKMDHCLWDILIR